jgi:hypothetical protein
MSKTLTPEPIFTNGCTQSTAPVFCCVATTSVEENKSVKYCNDAAPKPASFHFRTIGSRKKRYAPGSESATRHTGRIEGTSLISDQSSHIYRASTSSSSHHNTISFMKTLLSKTGLLTILLMFVSLFFVSNANGQNTGLLSPTTGVSISSVTNPTNAFSNNNQYAVFDASGDQADYGGFGISIPAGNAIVGIEVQLEGNRTSGRDLQIQLTWNNKTTFTSNQTMPSFATTDATRTVGSSTDLWGHAWTIAELSNTNFFVRVTSTSGGGNVNLDLVQVIIYYAAPLPLVTTVTPTLITNTTASSGGTALSQNGGPTIDAKGVVWGLSANPTVPSANSTNDGSGTTNYTSSVTGLTPQTLYNIRAYATSANGTGYGSNLTFRTLSNPPTVQASNLSGTGVSASQIDLTWTGATFPVSGATVTGYVLLRATSPNLPSLANGNGVAPTAGANTTIVSSTIGSGATTFSNTGLSVGTTYNYLLIPFSWDGTNAATYNYLTAGAPTATASTVESTVNTDHFRTISSGNWNVPAIWESSHDGLTNWIPSTLSPTSAANTITVQAGHIVNVTASETIDQTTINSTGQLNVNSGITLTIADGTGTDLTATGILSVDGIVNNQGSITSTLSTALFNAGSTYTHNQNAGIIPTATWNTTSTCQVILASGDATGFNQTFGNFTWAPSNQGTNNVDIGNGFGCTGNLTISPTNAPTGALRLNNITTPITSTVGGNLSQTGGVFIIVNSSGTGTLNVNGNLDVSGGTFINQSGTADATLHVLGNLNVSGGTFTAKEDNGNAILNVDGNYSQSAGTFNFRTSTTTGTASMTVTNDFGLSGTAAFNMTSSGASTLTVGRDYSLTSATATHNMSSTGAVGTMNVARNFSHTAGTITETSTGSGAINFNGSNQTYTSGGTLANTINFTVNTGSTLQMGTGATPATISGSNGTFILQSNATLGVTSADGIAATGGTGNIQSTGTRTFSAGAHYIYNGAVNQVTGSGLTQNTPASLTINNSGSAGNNTVSLSAITTISGNVTISQGILDVGASNFALNVGGNWNNNVSTASFNPRSGTVTLNGTAQLINGSATTNFFNLTLANTGTKTFGVVTTVGIVFQLRVALSLTLPALAIPRIH